MGNQPSVPSPEQIKNQFESAFDPNKNGLNASIENTGNLINQSLEQTKRDLENAGLVLETAFNPASNGLSDSIAHTAEVLNPITQRINTFTEETNRKIQESLDKSRQDMENLQLKMNADMKAIADTISNAVMPAIEPFSGILAQVPFAESAADIYLGNTTIQQVVQDTIQHNPIVDVINSVINPQITPFDPLQPTSLDPLVPFPAEAVKQHNTLLLMAAVGVAALLLVAE